MGTGTNTREGMCLPYCQSLREETLWTLMEWMVRCAQRIRVERAADAAYRWNNERLILEIQGGGIYLPYRRSLREEALWTLMKPIIRCGRKARVEQAADAAFKWDNERLTREIRGGGDLRTVSPIAQQGGNVDSRIMDHSMRKERAYRTSRRRRV